TNIGDIAFGYCYSLTSVTIPSSVTSLGVEAFRDCTNLTSFYFEGDAPAVGTYTFYGDTNATAYYLPGTTGWEYFAQLTGLPTLPLPFTYTTNDDNTITITGYTGSGGDVTIPDTINGLPVTSIGRAAFWFCTSLTDVTIPNSVTSIGDYAFYNCTSLASVIIGTNVTSIGSYAFIYCNLASLIIPDSVTSIGDTAFGFCYSLTNVTIGNGVTSIGDYAFSNYYSSLTAVYFQGNAPSIGTDVFGGDNNVTVYYLPGTTGWENFAQLAGVPTLPLPFTYTTNADNTVTITGYTGSGGDVIIPDTINGLPVTSIGYDAFAYCTSLINVTIPTASPAS